MTAMSSILGDVISDTGDGFIVPHGGHYHYIPKSALSAGELYAALAVLNGGGKNEVNPIAPPSSQLASSGNPNQPISDPVTPTITGSVPHPTATNKGGGLAEPFGRVAKNSAFRAPC